MIEILTLVTLLTVLIVVLMLYARLCSIHDTLKEMAYTKHIEYTKADIPDAKPYTPEPQDERENTFFR